MTEITDAEAAEVLAAETEDAPSHLHNWTILGVQRHTPVFRVRATAAVHHRPDPLPGLRGAGHADAPRRVDAGRPPGAPGHPRLP